MDADEPILWEQKSRIPPEGRPNKIKSKIPMTKRVIGDDNGLYTYRITKKGVVYQLIGYVFT